MGSTKKSVSGVENRRSFIFKDLVVIKNTIMYNRSVWLSNKKTHDGKGTNSAIMLMDKDGNIYRDRRDRDVFIEDFKKVLQGRRSEYRFVFLPTDNVAPMSIEDYMLLLNFVQYNGLNVNLEKLEFKDLKTD